MMLEIFATMCGLIQSVLILFKRKENWIFYILNILSLILFSLNVKLYGDVIENLIYVIFGLLGLFTWYSKIIEKKFLKVKIKLDTQTIKKKNFIY